MKNNKIFAAFALLFTCFTSIAQYTAIPDLNFEQALISKGYDTGTPDGKVLTATISSITSLNVSKKSISNLTGIQDFVALQNLVCDSNQLTSLDVSKNTALVQLYCYSNQLTSLNVNKNTALIYLYCQSNQLTVLDVSNNNALKELFCYNNQLTTLDASKKTALTYLRCDNNQLTALDISQNTALNYLECQRNQLSTLDVSNNIALLYLYCHSNQLTTLDVSNNSTLETLYCDNNKLTTLDVSKNTTLGYLFCGSNLLTTLDVSKNTALIQLYCYSNPLTALDVSKNTALKELFCYSNQLTTLDLSKNIALKDLRCYNNQLVNLNVKNGNNSNIGVVPYDVFDATNNANLTCIQTDNTIPPSGNDWKKDTVANYNTDCNLTTLDFDKNENAIILYPNPTGDVVNIKLPASIILKKTDIYSLNGQKAGTSTQSSVSLKNLSKGEYLFVIETESGSTTKKVSKN